MEKNSAKISLGTAVCLFVIILLVASLIGMYLYYNKNEVNPIIKTDSNSEKVAIEENELYKYSDFDLIYKSLINTEYNNLKSFITSDNKIKNIDVSEITIYTEDYLNATGSKLSEGPDENTIMGACVYTVEFENIEGLALAGSPGGIHKISGNCLTDEKYFIFDKDTKKVELCTSIYMEETEAKENTETNISTSDEVALYLYSMNDSIDLLYTYIEDGYLYYFKENVEYANETAQTQVMFLNNGQTIQYSGLSNIKRIKTFNMGTSVNPVPFLITTDGKVYKINRWTNDNSIIVELYEPLKDYNVEDILKQNGEMYAVFEVLLKDGTTKVVEVKE